MKTRITIEEGRTIILPLITAQSGETVLEITQKPFSKLSLCYIQNGGRSESHAMTIRIFLEAGAQLNAFAGMFGGISSNLLCETFANGEGSSVHQRTLYFGDSDQQFDMRSTTVLNAPATTALVESKGILNDCSHGRFDGMIEIKNNGRGSDAKLIEHTLLLSPDARMDAIPGLNIETNEVRASHSASMTRVDDEQLFYSTSRGIEEAEAIRLIAEGFLKTLYKDMPIRKDISQLIKMKLCKK